MKIVKKTLFVFIFIFFILSFSNQVQAGIWDSFINWLFPSGGETSETTDTTGDFNTSSESSHGSNSSEDPATLDDMFDVADDFFNTGLKNENKVINTGNLQVTSNFIYNILLAIAVVVAVIWGLILGIQFLIGAAEQRAETKKALAPYLVGCVVIFGAFGIWAFVVNILQSIK